MTADDKTISGKGETAEIVPCYCDTIVTVAVLYLAHKSKKSF